MGADSSIMRGIGQEELWRTVYAAGSIPQMTSGMAYDRALRAHILTAQGTITLILEISDSLKFFDQMKLQRIWDDMLNENISLEDAVDSPIV